MSQGITIWVAETGRANELAKAAFTAKGSGDGGDKVMQAIWGKFACAQWLENSSILVQRAFEDANNNDADLIATRSRTLRLDVKTWSQKGWLQTGGSIAATQMGRVSARADGIIWCVVPSAGKQSVEIVGWNFLSEARGMPDIVEKEGNLKEIHRVKSGAIHPPEMLLQFLR